MLTGFLLRVLDLPLEATIRERGWVFGNRMADYKSIGFFFVIGHVELGMRT